MMRLSEDVVIDLVETADIGGTNMTTGWRLMDQHDQATLLAKLGATVTDPLTTLKFEQATSSGGAGAKDLTTSGTGKQYDSANLAGVAGDQVCIEVRSEDMDGPNGFKYIRGYAACAANAGVDNVCLVMILSRALYPRKHLAIGDPSSHAMYVTRFGTVFS